MHERDISHSSAERVILPDSTIALDYMLHKMIQTIGGLRVFPEQMLEEYRQGLWADILAKGDAGAGR
jgi:adenylosuccinate lyase